MENMNTIFEALGASWYFAPPATEDQIKDAGIKVYDDDGWKADDAHPYLYIRVNSMKSGDDKFFAFSLDVELHQDVNLPRDTNIDTLAATWETGSFGILETEHAKRIYKSVEKEVGEFIDDFNAQNSETSSSGTGHHKAAQAPTGARRVARAD